ncbi:hypothetical protein [Novosphingopyxis sp. YJ-S2-01]|nr:hypothetical protein [Novosphingopyxis sp. YJ-S2-01]MBH9536946.1 hypothetical protein [Novosphingopyxis sp. YJ-S2-01]
MSAKLGMALASDRQGTTSAHLSGTVPAQLARAPHREHLNRCATMSM